MKKISLIIPVYNEASALTKFLPKLYKFKKAHPLIEIIFVNDNSSDKTLEILKSSNGQIISHKRNFGYGASLKTGINQASGDIIGIIDADSTYNPYDLGKMIPFIDDNDMVVGARIGSLAQQNFPLYQKAAKGFMKVILFLLFRKNVLDINSGLRLFKREKIMSYLKLLPDGFSFTATITLVMLLNKHKIKYIPIQYYQRPSRSKVKLFSYTVKFIYTYIKIILLSLSNKIKKA